MSDDKEPARCFGFFIIIICGVSLMIPLTGLAVDFWMQMMCEYSGHGCGTHLLDWNLK